MVAAFRRLMLLPLDDRLYALQVTIPHLTRSSLHRCLQRHRRLHVMIKREGLAVNHKKFFRCYP
jgi:hypothetical protein